MRLCYIRNTVDQTTLCLRACDYQENLVAKPPSSDVDFSGQNPPTSQTTDVDKLVSSDSETTTRLPFTNSLASTVHSDRSRTHSSPASETEHRTTAADCVRSDAVIQNGFDPPNPLSHSAARVGDAVGVPLLGGSTNGGMAQPTATLATPGGLLQREVENCVAQWTGDATQLGVGRPVADVGQTVGKVETVAEAVDDGWYYCDPQGQIQGEVLLMVALTFHFYASVQDTVTSLYRILSPAPSNPDFYPLLIGHLKNKNCWEHLKC